MLTEALRIDKNNVRIYVAKASMEMRANNFTEARATLKRATQLSSESDGGQHYTMWATLEIEAGNFREARRLLEEGAAKYPGDQVIHNTPYQYTLNTHPVNILCQYTINIHSVNTLLLIHLYLYTLSMHLINTHYHPPCPIHTLF